MEATPSKFVSALMLTVALLAMGADGLRRRSVLARRISSSGAFSKESSDARIEFKTERDVERWTTSTPTMGTLKLLMVRVIDSNGHGPTHSVEQMRSNLFEGDASLKSQYEACSYNKLKIIPYSDDKVSNGIYELKVDVDSSKYKDKKTVRNAAIKDIDSHFGGYRYNTNIDLIMLCLPPGLDYVGAYSSGSKLTTFSDEWCFLHSGQMHEIGHNLGLGHSGVQEQGSQPKAYGDRTGSMGASAGAVVRKCFNAAKNWQLGWYSDQAQTIDPLERGANKNVRTFVLNGVSDYKKNKNALIALRLEENSSTGDYYIGYNRMAGITSDVAADDDMTISILRKEGAVQANGVSWRVASLRVGHTYRIKKFNNQRDVEIKFVGKKDDNIDSKCCRDATIEVIDVDNANAVTVNPDPCETYTIEIQTDNHPDDTSWEVIETSGIGRGFGSNPESKYEKNSFYSTKVCLPYNRDYKFIILDNWGDGLCCQQGKGYYRMIDSKGKEVFKGGKMFKKDEKTFKVVAGIEKIGDKPCSTGYMGSISGQLESLEVCAQTCKDNSECEFLSYCPGNNALCTGGYKNKCALYKSCGGWANDYQGYTTYKLT